jgi:hypothetical protein
MITDIHEWVRVFELPQSQARDFLYLVRSVGEYLDLYQHFFPDDFAASIQQSGPLIPGPESAYTNREVQFLHLLNKHFFPIPEYVLDDPCPENRCYTVPIEPYGLGSIYEYGSVADAVEEMDLGWQLLFYLEGELPAEFFEGVFDHAIFALPITSRVDRGLLERRCKELTGPLSGLHQAIAMIDHDTGTAWLDATYDMPIEDARWEREVVDELTRQFREGQEIWKKANEFVQWLEEDIEAHFTEVVNLWNRCRVPNQNRG